jgi:2''-5'' RNA ligase
MMWAVLALDVVCEQIGLRQLLQGEASRFAPHISVLPRCLVNEEQLQTLRAVHLRYPMPFRAELRGPKSIDELLLWYECENDCAGYGALTALHQQALRQTAQSGIAPDKRYSGAEFRPHLTLRSGMQGPVEPSLPSTIWIKPCGIVIYTFEDGTDAEVIRQIPTCTSLDIK